MTTLFLALAFLASGFALGLSLPGLVLDWHARTLAARLARTYGLGALS